MNTLESPVTSLICPLYSDKNFDILDFPQIFSTFFIKDNAKCVMTKAAGYMNEPLSDKIFLMIFLLPL